MTDVKEKLTKAIEALDDRLAEKLLQEWEDILLQLKLENDPEFLKDVEKARQGENVVDHNALKKELNA